MFGKSSKLSFFGITKVELVSNEDSPAWGPDEDSLLDSKESRTLKILM